MKKLTATFPDSAVIDLASIAAIAVDLRIETLPNGLVKSITRHRPAGMSTDKAIMQHFTPAGNFRASNAKAWLEKEEYSPNSFSGVMSRLKQQGNVSHVKGDKWQFVKALSS